MTQRDIIFAAFQRGDHIRGSDSLRTYNIAEPSFKRIVHELRESDVKIEDTEIPTANGSTPYKEYFLVKENDGSLSASNLPKADKPNKLPESVSKLKIDTSSAATRPIRRQLDSLCPACGASYYIIDGKCNKCGVVRAVPAGWFANQ